MSKLHKISGCDNAGRKADVVFIHGLGGDPFETWRFGDADNTSWPHWLGAEFEDVGVWSLGYAASPTKWLRFRNVISRLSRDAGYSMALPDRARQVLDLMGQQSLGQRPLLLICHSLGGLLAKQTLRTSNDAGESKTGNIARQTRAVLFVATPHSGAAIASFFNAFSTAFGTTVSLAELRAHDPHLRDLFNWYRKHAPTLNIATKTYYESRNLKGVLPIVDPSSAHPGVGDDPIELEEDHLSIAKPRSKSSQICGAARDLLRDHVLTAATAPATPHVVATGVISASPVATPFAPPAIHVHIDANALRARESVAIPHVVPHQIPTGAEKYFGRSVERAALIDRLRAGKNTVVVGPAGLGKTALVAVALRDAFGPSLADSPFPDGMVVVDLYAHHGDVEKACADFANALAGAEFMKDAPEPERARAACQIKRTLLVVEGGEEADGESGRGNVHDLLRVLSSQSRYLLMTRLSTQATVQETISLTESLSAEDAGALLDDLTQRGLPPAVRDSALTLLEGHPLALTWAGNLLARGDDDPAELIDDWQRQALPALSDAKQAQHTLHWLFSRSVRGLDNSARIALSAAGLLARAPFSRDAIAAALQSPQAAREAIKTLAQRGLLQRSPAPGSWQFTHVLGYRFARDETASDASRSGSGYTSTSMPCSFTQRPPTMRMPSSARSVTAARYSFAIMIKASGNRWLRMRCTTFATS